MVRTPAHLAQARAQARAIAKEAIALAMLPGQLRAEAARETDPLVRAELLAQASAADRARTARNTVPQLLWGEVRP